MHNRSIDTGYVLPYVLAVILILSIVTSIAAKYIIDSTTLFRSMEEKTEVDIAFASAQAMTEFILVNSVAVEGGYDLSGEVDPLSQLLGQQTTSENQDIWRVDGEWRFVNLPQGRVYIQLRDTSGLVSLNNGSQASIEALLIGLKLEKTKAQTMTATLLDYRDIDNTRRFRGGERADYRLQKLPTPTNRPLRHYGELNRILGWEEALNTINMPELINLTTFQLTGSRVNFNFSSEVLNSHFADLRDNLTQNLHNDVLDSALSQQKTPFSPIRVTLLNQGDTGLIRERLLEIELQPSHPWKPFQTFHVSDNSYTDQTSLQDWIGNPEVKRVLYAPYDMAQ